MKKFTFLFLIAVCCGAQVTQAQIQRGNVLIGGNLSNINIGLNKPSVFSFEVTPKAAWFIEDNLAVGGFVDLGISTANNSPTTTRYGVGALGRYYAGTDVEVLRHGRFFGEATLGLGGQNVSDGGGSTNGLNYSFGPGFAYFVTPNIGLETLLKYNGISGFGGNQKNLNLSFGFQIYLPGRGTAAKVQRDAR